MLSKVSGGLGTRNRSGKCGTVDYRSFLMIQTVSFGGASVPMDDVSYFPMCPLSQFQASLPEDRDGSCPVGFACQVEFPSLDDTVTAALS